MSQGIEVSRLRERVAELLARYRIPGVAVGVLRDGRVTEFAVGQADVARGRTATVDTVFQCGSMTKTWTALAFLGLADAGLVDLDAPVRTWLPEFAVADDSVAARLTPRRLLNHTNGIEEDYGDPGEGDDVLARVVAGIAEAPQVHPLGGTHGYSAALGYAILGRIMEVVTGSTWDAVMARRLFAPMDLRATTTRPERVDPDRAAVGYLVRSPTEGPIPSPIPHLPRSYGPGGGLLSTVGEVLELARVILDGGVAATGERIVSADAIHRMTTCRVPVPDPYPFGPWWGLGLTVDTWDGRTVYGHDGSTIGFNARLRILPQSRLAITTLCNGGPHDGFHRGLFDAILAAAGEAPMPPPPRPDPTSRLDPARYVGVYERLGTRFEVSSRDGALTLTRFTRAEEAAFLGWPRTVTRQLLPIDATHFVLAGDGPLEDDRTVALYDFTDGVAGYLHTDSRVTPRSRG